MALTNIERMINLAEEVFDTRNDPEQLDVDHEVLGRLQRIHPAAVSEYDDGNGPAAWILLIPTTRALMQDFVESRISEKELFLMTPENGAYDALYLCSALVLEEYRRKGIARKLTLKAIEKIRKDHPVQTLFVWPYSTEGDKAAVSIAQLTGLPLTRFTKRK